eukprot:13303755-Alexandrium_andersonii.AAC.1
MARSRDAIMHLSPTDPNASKPSAGVGALAVARTRLACVSVASRAFCRFQALGRVAVFHVDAGLDRALVVFSVYGWTGANRLQEARERTSELADA